MPRKSIISPTLPLSLFPKTFAGSRFRAPHFFPFVSFVFWRLLFSDVFRFFFRCFFFALPLSTFIEAPTFFPSYEQSNARLFFPPNVFSFPFFARVNMTHETHFFAPLLSYLIFFFFLVFVLSVSPSLKMELHFSSPLRRACRGSLFIFRGTTDNCRVLIRRDEFYRLYFLLRYIYFFR